MTFYLFVKFVHVLTAIIALGSSAGSSFWLRMAQRDQVAMAFALRTAKRLDEYVTRPGLILLLITGFWMAATRWSLSLLWVRVAIAGVVLLLVVLYGVIGPTFEHLLRLLDRQGSPEWRRTDLSFELVGGAAGLLIVLIVFLMVAKPS